jgi:hypothetical protein
VTAHSEKEQAKPTWKKTFGVHPLAAFADHGTGADGEALAIMLRPGKAGSSTAAEHIEVTRLALAQLPRRSRGRVLVRTESGGTHDFLAWLASPGRRLHRVIQPLIGPHRGHGDHAVVGLAVPAQPLMTHVRGLSAVLLASLPPAYRDPGPQSTNYR